MNAVGQRAYFASLRGARISDIFAGLTLAAIAIPEQMATARLAGLEPHVGFVAFIAGSLAFALFGANRYVSVGADSTIAPIFAGALALMTIPGTPAYAAHAALLALLVGGILMVSGLLRAGWIADLLSVPVLTGFLAGISIHIALSQAPAFFGLPAGHGEPLQRLQQIAATFSQLNPTTFLIGAASLATIVFAEAISPRIPGALIALAGASWAFVHFHLEAQGVAVLGAIAHEIPHLSLPPVSLMELSDIGGLAVIIALVVMVQTSATSRAFSSDPDALNIDRDFFGVGVGSVFAGLFGAFPVNASPPRTAIIHESGGASQWAGLVALAIVGAVLIFGGGALAQAPTAALAAVLMYVAARIFRLADMIDIFRQTRGEFLLVLVTLLAVVLLPVQTGVAIAIILSLVHGVYTITRTRLIEFERIRGATVWWPPSATIQGETLDGVLVVAFQAPLSFINADLFRHDFRKAIARADGSLRLVVLEASSIVEIDYSAAKVLRQCIETCRHKGVDFAIARLESVRAQEAIEKFGVLAALGPDRLFHSVDEATRTLLPEASQHCDK